MQPEWIGFPQCVPYYLITIARPFICPHKYVSKKLNAVQLVNSQQPIDIKVFWHIHEGQRTQIVMNERNIRRQSRYPFIDVLKRLEVGQVYCDKKCLFEGIGYCGGGIQDLAEDFID